MTNLKKVLIAPILLVCTLMVLNSCTKEETAISSTDDQMLSGEELARQPSPGTYVVTKFIDTGDDETSIFNGYTFKFQANGSLVVTFNGQTFNGSWDLNSAETVMTITIAGTNALDNLDDDDWNVLGITNMRIKLQKPGPDKVVFTRI